MWYCGKLDVRMRDGEDGPDWFGVILREGVFDNMARIFLGDCGSLRFRHEGL